jgi:hypothetical protein
MGLPSRGYALIWFNKNAKSFSAMMDGDAGMNSATMLQTANKN